MAGDDGERFKVITKCYGPEQMAIPRRVAHISVRNASEQMDIPKQVVDKTRNLLIPLPFFETRIRIAERLAQKDANLLNELSVQSGIQE